MRPNETLELIEHFFYQFLHLLGCDTNGHANKPHSKELLHNIQVLDQRVSYTGVSLYEY
jgi:hypothetical protein